MSHDVWRQGLSEHLVQLKTCIEFFSCITLLKSENFEVGNGWCPSIIEEKELRGKIGEFYHTALAL